MVKNFIQGGLSTGPWDEFRILGASKYLQEIVLRLSRESGGILPWKMLKIEPLRLAKNAFPAYSYGHEVSWKTLVQLFWTMQEKGFIDRSYRFLIYLITLSVEKENLSLKQK